MPSSKKQRGKKKRLMREQKENEERREEELKPECRCGVTTDEALFEAYGSGLKEYVQLLNREEDFGEGRRYFIDNNPNLCSDDGFVKYIIGYCSSDVMQNPSITDGTDDYSVHCLADLALTSYMVYIPYSKGEGCRTGKVRIVQCMNSMRSGSGQKED